MSAKSSDYANDLLLLIFNGTAISGIADNAASSPLTELYVALHTDDPLVGGDQSENECAYTGYARVAVDRDATGFVVTGNAVNPAAIISFPECTDGDETATYFSIGVAASGATMILYRGAIEPVINISNGVTPQLGTQTEVQEL